MGGGGISLSLAGLVVAASDPKETAGAGLITAGVGILAVLISAMVADSNKLNIYESTEYDVYKRVLVPGEDDIEAAASAVDRHNVVVRTRCRLPSAPGQRPIVPRTGAGTFNHSLGSAKPAAAADGRDGRLDRGMAYLQGRQVPKDVGKALGTFKEACDAGVAEGCRTVAAILWDGKEVIKDEKLAMHFFDLGCRRKDATSCYFLGVAHFEGRGAPGDLARATYYFKLGCSLGTPRSCEVLDGLKAVWR